jgi:hypothetical protein
MAVQLRRRWFRFSLRTLLALITVVAVPVAWLAGQLRAAQRETEIADQLRTLGFQFEIGYPSDSWRSVSQGLPTDRVRAIARHTFGEKVLIVLNPPANFNSLTLFTGMQHLQALHLNSTQVSDLAPIVAFSSLQTLRIMDSPVRDISPLVELKKLRVLDLSFTQVEDLAPIAELSGLQWIDLRSTMVRDLQPLVGLPNLQWLWLNDTPVSELTPLASVPTLQSIDLHGAAVTDLTPLAKLPNLVLLNVRDTQVEQSQIDALQQALPKCKINHARTTLP